MNSKNNFFSIIAIFISTLLLTSCANHKDYFEDVSLKVGIDFIYNFGDKTYENILESSGSGITVFDYNGDGLMDVYLMNGSWLEGISDSTGLNYKNTPNKLYKNIGNGTFAEVAKEAGIDDKHWSMAAGPIDYDNDGDQDLYLLNYGPNIFYRNNGDGTFSDLTAETGLAGPDTLNGYKKWSIGVSYFDYNKDGLIDAFVGNFLAFDPEYMSATTPDLMPHPSEYNGQASMLYLQDSLGYFTEVTQNTAFYYPYSMCMGLTVFDYDLDGDLDIFQGNDHQANFMFKNEGNEYKEVGLDIGVALNSHGQTTGSMHGAIGDIDGDGNLDMLVPDLRYGALYRSIGNGAFEDITDQSGVANAFSGKGQWASALFDYDNDGDLDIFSANGNGEALILQYPLLMENDGKGNFSDIGKNMGAYFKSKRSGRSAAIWDYDDDGDLDIIVSHVDLQGNAVLLRNNSKNENHWMGLILCSENGPSATIGATVKLYTNQIERVYSNQWSTTYLTNSDPRLHIGLGKLSTVDSLQIYWADGLQQTIYTPPTDSYLTISQGEGICD